MNVVRAEHELTLRSASRGKGIVYAVCFALILSLVSMGLAGRAQGSPAPDPAPECTADSAPYRINAGGPELQTPNGVFCADEQKTPSPHVNEETAGNRTFVLKPEDPTVDMSDPSIPAGTTEALFRTERWDPKFSQIDGQGVPNAEMSYAFPVAAGTYEVRLYFAEIWNSSTTNQIDPSIVCCQAEGKRVFDVLIEGDVKLNDYDVFKEAGGGFKGIVETFTVTSEDGTVNIDFQRMTQNPAIKAIEILPPDAPPGDTADPTISGLKPSGKIRDRTPKIGATVRDAEGELGKEDIRLYVDGKARAFSYSQATDRLSAVSRRLSYGGHAVRVVATDDAGNTATETSRFRVIRRR